MVGKVVQNASSSWKTSALGIIAGIMLILPQVSAVFDNDPETVPQWNGIMAGLAAMGLGIASRDGDKSSEDVGAK